tara:strand:+ start:3822 stop:4109 length:288 start_codon:yes stop_codon:yes gene_type:complete
MKIIRYIDIVQPVVNEEGQMFEKVMKSNFTLPTIIDPSGVDSISPLFSGEGKLFKNVSIISYHNEMYKVVGNYIKLNDQLKGKGQSNFTGFKNGQ